MKKLSAFLVPLLCGMSAGLSAQGNDLKPNVSVPLDLLGQPTFRKPVAPSDAATKPAKSEAKFHPNRILVKFKGFKTGAAAKQLTSQAQNALAAVGGKVVNTITSTGVQIVEVSGDPGKAAETLINSGTVVYAQRDSKVKALGLPNDPLMEQLWGLNNTGQYIAGTRNPGWGTPDADIDAPEAWNVRQDASQTIVGVVDTGVDYTHEDLALNMWTNPNEIPANGIDDDANGFVDDVYGANFILDNGDPMDDMWYNDVYHGTHVSGTIGARGNNGKGVAGVGWKAKIMGLKFLDEYGSGWNSDAVQAIDYALKIKAANSYKRMVLSNSWGGGSYDQSLYDIIKTAGQQNVLFVVAAGNDYANTDYSPVYPASYDLPNVLAVGATDFNDVKADFSNYGCGSVDVSAPGQDILSTKRYNAYQYLSGTSMATPHVSGIAALVWSKFPTYNYTKIKAAIMSTVEQKEALMNTNMTGGRVNLDQAIRTASVQPPTVFKVDPVFVEPGASVSLTGLNFGTTAGSVEVNGVAATVVSWSNTLIKIKLAASTLLGYAKVIVNSPAKGLDPVGACINVSRQISRVGQTFVARGWSAGAQAGAYLWQFGGESNFGSPTSLVERTHLSTGRTVLDSGWSMTMPLTNIGAAAYNGKIYVVGGFDPYSSSVYNNLQIFNTSTGKWTQGPALPEPLAQVAVVASGGKIYAIGGFDSYLYSSNRLYVYNPVNQTWTAGALKPTAVAYAGAVPQSDGKILVAGGTTCGPYFGCETTVVEEYDPATDSWTSGTSMNHPRMGQAMAYNAADDITYAFFGADYYGAYYNARDDGESFNSGAWTDYGSTGNGGLYTSVGGSYGGYGYALHGYSYYYGAFSNAIWKAK